MKKYNFYYDETEHSRRIGYNTITSENYYDNFITAIIGWNIEYESKMEEKYLEFENKYGYRKSNGELKSTSIKNKFLKNGLASSNEDTIKFLDDFFSVFSKEIFIYFSVVSKIEYVVLQLFRDYKNSILFDMDLLKYTITKALNKYKPKEVLECIYNNPENLVKKLKAFFKSQIELHKNNLPLKEKEIQAFENVIYVLNTINKSIEIDWEYRISFDGFQKFTSETSTNNCFLFIDKEGSGNTLKAAKKVGLDNVKEVDSSEHFGVRMADMFAGIIAKIQKSLRVALDGDIRTVPKKKTILSEEWFKLSDEQLSLYKKMYKVVVELNNCCYKTYSGIYSDDLISFISLLNFFNQYKCVDKLNENIGTKGEEFNVFVCSELEKYYKKLSNKLPLQFAKKDCEEFSLNQRGAKVYNDIRKQPIFKFPVKDVELTVLSVGFNKEMSPLVTILEENVPKCYRFPNEYLDWVMCLVAISNKGTNVLPSKVLFSKIGDKYYADIL